MKKLRIIDKSDQVEIQYVDKEQAITDTVNYFPSPVDDFFKERLSWYFQEYLLNPYGKNRKTAKTIENNMEKFGRAMGDHLFRASKSLDKLVEALDSRDVAISIESDNPEFFDEPWEIMILPRTSQSLSSSCASFIRTQFQASTWEKENLSLSEKKPLRILMVVSRPQKPGIAYQNNALDIFNLLLGYHPIVEIELLNQPDVETIQQRLLQDDRPFHILHLDTPAMVKKGTPYLVLEDQNQNELLQDIKTFSELMTAGNVNLLFLDTFDCTDPKKTRSTTSTIAVNLLKNNVKGVITKAQTTYAFTSIQLFQIIYSQIAIGRSLAEAVVESRKYMMDNAQQNFLTANRQDYLDWPLLVHYGTKDIQFFNNKNQGMPFFQSKPFSQIVGRMPGFRHDLLPPNEFFGQTQYLDIIETALFRNKTVILQGSSGIGKTHFLHHFAYRHMAGNPDSNAYYFDFKRQFYRKDDILDIIGQHLDGEFADPASTFEKLSKNGFLLIFDSIDTVGESLEDLIGFIRETDKTRSTAILVTNDSGIPERFAAVEKIRLQGLGLEQARQLGIRTLQKIQLEDEEGDPEYLHLLDSLEGHPFVIQTILRQLGKQPADVLFDKFQRKKALFADSDADPLFALFELGWENISKDFQTVLAALSNIDGFITDGLAIAFDMKEKDIKTPGQTFFELLDVPRPYSMSDVIQAGVESGLYLQKEFGKEVQTLAPVFLRQKRLEYQRLNEKTDRIDRLLKKVCCSELKVLAPFLSQNPNPVLIRKIIENHRRWLDSVRSLWDNQEYAAYTGCTYLLSSIFNQIGLKTDFQKWSFDIVAQFDFSTLSDNFQKDLAIAWLKTACDGIQAKDAMESDTVSQWVSYWETWINATKIENASIFDHVLMFLETYYRIHMDWFARKHISSVALKFYQKENNHHRTIAAMKSLAKCEEALGDLAACREYENKILNETPFDQLEKGLQNKILLDVIQLKLNRMEFDDADTLLADFHNLPEKIDELSVVAESFQGEILMKQKKLEEATKVYSKLWSGVINRTHMFHPEKILERLKELESKIGAEEFSRIFKENAPGVATPSELQQQAEQPIPAPGS